MSKNKMVLAVLIILALLLLASGALIFQYNFKHKGTALPRVYLNGQSYAGISQTDAKASLESKVADTYKYKMKLVYKDKTYLLALSDLGVGIDSDKTINEIVSYGQGGNLSRDIQEQLNLLTNHVNFKNEISDQGFLIEKTKWSEISKIESPAQDFTYRWNGSAFMPVNSREGYVIDTGKLKEDIENNLINLQNDPIQIELVKDRPVISKAADSKALTDAQNLVKRKVALSYGSLSWDVAPSDFGSWIGFTPQSEDGKAPTLVLSPNTDQIKNYLVTLIPEINREPVNAQLEFKDGKVGVFTLSQDGIQVDADASTDAISKQLFQTKNYTPAISASALDNATDVAATQALADMNSGKDNTTNDADKISIVLAVKSIAPDLTTDNIDNMGITSLLATGESNFHGSTASRQHNIAVGASKFNGILIGPGDTFSFDKILGEVGAKQGYLPELVIKSGKTIPEFGGGLCQVSTTAFRAAVAAGLEVTQRSNHAYAVKYYAPQGTDATIYPPNPDLAFINNTPAYILIQTRISGNNLYFDFYGTNDGRKVVTEGPVVYERGAGGAMKTWWKQSVYDKDGKMFLTKTFYSNYKSATLYPTQKNPLE